MKLESIRAIAMGCFLLQVTGQVDDGNSIEGALLDADTAPDAQDLREERHLYGSC
jgi:hypothetical protein